MNLHHPEAGKASARIHAAPRAMAEPADAQDVILKMIRGWRWFAFVPPEAQQWLATHASIRQVARGKPMYLSGDPATTIYGVISGVFRIFLASPNGDEITLEEVVRGGWFPHMIPGESPHYLANCICQQEATVVTLAQPAIAEFARQWPGYYRGLYQELTERAPVIHGRIELLSLHNLNVRLAVYLLRMERLRGVKEDSGAIWVAAEDSQSEIGARVGGTRQRVNSVLKAWQQRGLIELHKDGTRILDIKRLRAEAQKSGFDVTGYLAGWHGGWQGKQ